MSFEVWSDLHHSLTTDASGEIKKVINSEAVRTSIDNILRTNQGERVMRRDFGTGIKSLVFEPATVDTFDEIVDLIKDSIQAWDDRIILNSVDIYVDPDNNSVTFKIFFSIRGYEQVFEYSTELIGG